MPYASAGNVITSSAQLGTGVVLSQSILDGEIVNADIATGAAIGFAKLAGVMALVTPGSNGNYLKSDGTNWTSAAPIFLQKQSESGAQTTITNDTTETDIFSFSLPAATLGTAGFVEIYVPISDFQCIGSSGVFKLYYGGQSSTIDLGSFNVAGSFKGYVRITLLANAATNAQRLVMYGDIMVNVTTGLAPVNAVRLLTTAALTVDSAAAQTLRLTFKWAGAFAANIFTREGYWVISN